MHILANKWIQTDVDAPSGRLTSIHDAQDVAADRRAPGDACRATNAAINGFTRSGASSFMIKQIFVKEFTGNESEIVVPRHTNRNLAVIIKTKFSCRKIWRKKIKCCRIHLWHIMFQNTIDVCVYGTPKRRGRYLRAMANIRQDNKLFNGIKLSKSFPKIYWFPRILVAPNH